MTEGLFILTTLFVAYVVYQIINDKKSSGASAPAAAPAEPKAEKPQPAKTVETKPAPAAKTVVDVKAATEAPKTTATAKVVAPTPKAAPAAEPAAVKSAATPPVKPTAAKPAAPKPAAAANPAKTEAPAASTEPQTVKGTGLKDPKTGEIVTAYSNYRFAKRWVKEALVAEKLVDKVYKNDELNADIEGKIRVGISKLEAMKKYQP
ncbi:MAG: hypothetical protein FJ190_07765 [Gammaproteobacteria bacterium]|nr:hypothetical protein [Gammaproteobacteria bacterium]